MRTLSDATKPGWKGPRHVDGSHFTMGHDGAPAAVVLEPDSGRAGNLVYPLTRADGDDPETIETLEGRRFAFDDWHDQDARLYDALYGTEG